MWRVVTATPRADLSPPPLERDSVPIVQEPGWDTGPVWTRMENLAPSGFDPRAVQPIAIRCTDSTKILYGSILSPIRATCLAHLIYLK